MRMVGVSDFMNVGVSDFMNMFGFGDPTADATAIVFDVRTFVIDHEVEERWFHTFGLPDVHFVEAGPSATGDHHVRSSH